MKPFATSTRSGSIAPGTAFPISLTVSPIRDLEGRIIGASKIVRDISPLRQIELERMQLLQETAAISKQLVEMHGGTIVASSDGPGTGATFSVTLPTHNQQS